MSGPPAYREVQNVTVTPEGNGGAFPTSMGMHPPEAQASIDAPVAQTPDFLNCVRKGTEGFSMKATVSDLTGGRVGNGIVSDALLGSSVTPVIDIIQAYRHGDFKDMFKEGAKVAAEKAVDKGIEKGAEHTPNVAVTLATTATVVVSTPNASSIASVSSRITARIPTSTMARAGSNALSKFGTLVKTPWDASVTSFSALVCAMNY